MFLLHDVRKDGGARDLPHGTGSNVPTAESIAPPLAAGQRRAALRGESQRPSREETLELTRKIRFEELHLPEQNLSDHIADLNRHLEEAGVTENQLRILLDSRFERDWQEQRGVSGGPRRPEVELRKVTLGDAIRYLIDNTILGLNIEEGRLIFTSWKYQEDLTPENEKVVDETPLEAHPGEPDPFEDEADLPEEVEYKRSSGDAPLRDDPDGP